MIHYTLRCGDGHEFDAWFKSSASFDEQAARNLLDCPVCGRTDIARALMAPRIRTGRAALPPPQESAPEPAAQEPVRTMAVATPPSAAPAIPPRMRAVLQRIRAEVERNCDYVGPRFAQEARRMHDKEQPARPIYGEASQEEVKALEEDGIDVARIPWVPRADS